MGIVWWIFIPAVLKAWKWCSLHSVKAGEVHLHVLAVLLPCKILQGCKWKWIIVQQEAPPVIRSSCHPLWRISACHIDAEDGRCSINSLWFQFSFTVLNISTGWLCSKLPVILVLADCAQNCPYDPLPLWAHTQNWMLWELSHSCDSFCQCAVLQLCSKVLTM